MLSDELRSRADLLMTGSREALRNGESIVSELGRLGAVDHVALYAQAAAHHATARHPGVFASRELDAALVSAAQRIDPGTTPRSRPVGDPRSWRRILHVASDLPYPEGGHTRVMHRWIGADTTRQHSLALTWPGGEVPPHFVEAVGSSGGQIYGVAPNSGSFTARAVALRSIAMDFDAVVLHVHPYDVLPTLALAVANRPPTLTLNLAGHMFWIGRPAADLVACGRRAAARICETRRGLPAEATVVLPLPVAVPTPTPSDIRTRVRQSVGAAADDLVVLTIGSAYKLNADGLDQLSAVMGSALAQRARLIWLVVGPDPGQLPPVDDRMRCLGIRDDLAELYAAADAYLDSYPFTSQTAMLDAAAAGLPVIAFDRHERDSQILSAWGGALDESLVGFTDATGLGLALEALDDPASRDDMSARSLAAVSSALVGPDWLASVESVYEAVAARALCRGVAPPRLDADDDSQPTDLDRCLSLIGVGPEEVRTYLGWHRQLNDRGSLSPFPSSEAWVAELPGLPGLVGQLEMTLRDWSVRIQQLEQAP